MFSNRPVFSCMSNSDIERVHEASFRLLKETGVRVGDPWLTNLLQEHGCTVQGERVRFNLDLVQQMLDNVKKEITLVGRSGQRVELKPGNVFSHAFGAVPTVIDPETGDRRDALLEDIGKTVHIMNQLDHLEIPGVMLYPTDVPVQINQMRMYEQLLRYSEKPISGPGLSQAHEAKYIVEMFKAYADAFKNIGSVKQVGSVVISPEDPLYYPKDIVEIMKTVISAGVPVTMLPCPIVGLTAPLTIAGILTQTNATLLAFATMAHVINPDTPVIYGPRLCMVNMKNCYTIMGLPDVALASACAVQMAGRYGFVTDVYGLSTSSCTFDNQAGYEKAINGLIPVLAGTNQVSGLGSLTSGTVASYEQLIIDNELFGAILKVARGVVFNDDTMALDVINDVVLGGGNFVQQEHTVRHLRAGEIFMSKLGFDAMWYEWEAGGKTTIRDRARDHARQVLSDGVTENIPTELAKEFDGIVSTAQKHILE